MALTDESDEDTFHSPGVFTSKAKEASNYSAKLVAHVGPSTAHSGGIASVIKELTDHSNGKYCYTSLPTWSPTERSKGVLSTSRTIIHLLCNPRKYSLIHAHVSENGSFIRKSAIGLTSKLIRVPFACTIHGASFVEYSGRAKRTVKFLTKLCDHIFCLGQNHQQLIKQINPKVRTSVIVNPVNESIFTTKDSPKNQPLKVVFLGEAGRRKGIDRLIEAVQDERVQKSTTITIVGKLLNDADTIIPSTIVCLGERPREEALNILERSDLLILPSRSEVLPMAIIEALSKGLSVIYTKVGEWQELEGMPGVTLIDVDDVPETQIHMSIRNAILKEIDNQESLPSSQEIKDSAHSRFNTNSVVNVIEKTYNHIINSRKPLFKS